MCQDIISFIEILRFALHSTILLYNSILGTYDIISIFTSTNIEINNSELDIFVSNEFIQKISNMDYCYVLLFDILNGHN